MMLQLWGKFKSSTIEALCNVIDEKSITMAAKLYSGEKSRQYGEVFIAQSIKACNLHDLAQTTSVKIALTVDGADLFKGRTHVSTELKFF